MITEAYKRGREALKVGDYQGAVRDFETVLKDMEDHQDQYNHVVSCLGLSQVLTSNRNGLLLCRDAASSENQNGDVFLNLACAEWYCMNRRRAINAVRLGCNIDSENTRLKRALGLLDARKKSVLGFLPRAHLLNRFLGRMLRRATEELTIDRLLY